MLMVALNVSAGFAGQVLGRVRHYKLLPMCCALIAIAAVMTLGVARRQHDAARVRAAADPDRRRLRAVPSLTAVALQNMVARHQLGISVGTMNFTRNLYATMLIAVFGAIVLAGTVAGQPLDSAFQAGISATASGACSSSPRPA